MQNKAGLEFEPSDVTECLEDPTRSTIAGRAGMTQEEEAAIAASIMSGKLVAAINAFHGHRIGGRRTLRLMRKWLKVGVLEGTMLTTSESGTPQGAVVSPRSP